MKILTLIFFFIAVFPLFPKDIIILESIELPINRVAIDSFKEKVKGTFYEFNIEGSRETARKVVTEIKKLNPSLIFALGAKAAYIGKDNFRNIPVIFANVINWEKYDLKASNITGISLELPPENLFMQFFLLSKNIKKIGVLYSSDFLLQKINRAADFLRELNIELITLRAGNFNETREKFTKILPKIEAFWMVPDQHVYTKENFEFIRDSCINNKIPFLAFSEDFVKAGALFSLSPDFRAIGNQAAIITQELLEEGKNIKEFEILPPVGTFLVLNLNTAKKLDIQVPKEILNSCDKIFE